MLSLLIAIPLVGSLLIGLLPSSFTSQRIRSIALAFMAVTGLLTLKLTLDFDLDNPGFQWEEYLPWIPQLGLSYSLAMDGLSLPLVGLSAILTPMAIASSRPDMNRPRLYYSMILLVNAAIAGAFLSQNLLLFVLFYELELIPIYLLISI